MVAKVGLPFQNWEPDKSMISGVASEAKGVISQGGRYAPLKDLTPIRADVAMNDTCLGAAGFHDGSGGVRIFTGDRTKLYELQARAPVDISKIGGYAVNPDWAWVFEQFGNSIYATARGLPQIQRYEFGVSTKFGDVATGPGLSDTIFRVREFLFAGYGKTLRNSCFNNPLDWDPNSATGIQATIFDLPYDGGEIVIGTGGQFGVVFQERKIHRLTYQGGSTVFQRDEIEDKRGALGPNAISRYGMFTFFASEDGIRVTDGAGESQGIGEGKIDRYFASRLNYSARSRVSLAVDVEKRLLKVSFPTGGNSYCDEVLIYSMADGRWTHDDIAVDTLFEAPKQGATVDDTALIQAIAGTTLVDDITATVDSPIWRETRKQIMAVNGQHQVCTFEGNNRAAVVETGYGEVIPGRMGFLTEIWPLIDAATVTASVTTKLQRLSDPAINGQASNMNANGFCPVLAHARFMRARVMVPQNEAWSEAVGIDWDARPAGGL
jgi:hypothetical protein